MAGGGFIRVGVLGEAEEGASQRTSFAQSSSLRTAVGAEW